MLDSPCGLASLQSSGHEQKAKYATAKTYNSGDSLVVTHLTTSPPVSCLNRAERTGSLALKILWSYVKDLGRFGVYIDMLSYIRSQHSQNVMLAPHSLLQFVGISCVCRLSSTFVGGLAR
jgi:hypothetical protein